MAATRARCIGYDATRRKDASRLGSKMAEAHADTWQTFTCCYVNADGTGYVQVCRGARMVTVTFGPEGEPFEPVVQSLPA